MEHAMSPEMHAAGEKFAKAITNAAALVVEQHGHTVVSGGAAAMSEMSLAVARAVHEATGAEPKFCGKLAKLAVMGALAKRFDVGEAKFREWVQLSGLEKD
jgi:hypothetical protein